MCEVGVCSVYITQDTEEKNAACVLLYQYSCISSGSLLQGWTLLRCWQLYVCLLSKVGMGSSNRLFAGIIKLPNLLSDSRCVLVFLCLWVCERKRRSKGACFVFFFTCPADTWMHDPKIISRLLDSKERAALWEDARPKDIDMCARSPHIPPYTHIHTHTHTHTHTRHVYSTISRVYPWIFITLFILQS